MKLKITLIIVGTAVIGGSILVAITESRERKERQQAITESHERVSTAMSNYNKTFKLNTNPPIWPDAPKK
ncbi:MAG: hypothetical protein SFY81_02805 [Verrucomicrobiota bacterium]|nr:hypothetical protein [Verrucomicrobiota bacterium]